MVSLKDLTDLMASSNLTEAQMTDLSSALTVMQKENKFSKRGKKVVLSAKMVKEWQTAIVCARIVTEPLEIPMVRPYHSKLSVAQRR